MKLWLKQVDGVLDRGVQGLGTQDQGDCGHKDQPFDCVDLKIEPKHDRNQRGDKVNPEITLGQTEQENSASGVRKTLRTAFHPFGESRSCHYSLLERLRLPINH